MRVTEERPPCCLVCSFCSSDSFCTKADKPLDEMKGELRLCPPRACPLPIGEEWRNVIHSGGKLNRELEKEWDSEEEDA